ncbi:hypothetical protein [Paraburkholderia sp. RL17-347-BIC-D]|uniref:hypothetical protein n=2 Tax=unclassified Paraburkholderia TaxID=2615204 RepID=UPI0038BE1B47
MFKRLKTIESCLRELGIVRFDVGMYCCEASDIPMFPLATPASLNAPTRSVTFGHVRARSGTFGHV